jgi:antitoxin PrlF
MPISTLTSKGQITLPRQIRQQLKLQSGDKLNFQVETNGVVTLSPINKKVSDVFGILEHRGEKPVAVGDMDRKVKEAFLEGGL